MEWSNKVLLTGAGFTHNFGTPLAKDMWYNIFNDDNVQENPNIRELMLSESDYESVYFEVMNGEYKQEEKLAMDLAIRSAYENLDRTVREFVFNTDAAHPVNTHLLYKSFDLFAERGKRGIFFTLNQDLFIERQYTGMKKPSYLGVRNNLSEVMVKFKQTLQKEHYSVLPSEEEINSKKEEMLKGCKFAYIKLHGSQNWQSKDGKQLIIIGKGKLKQIENEPVLKWYSRIFKEVLSREGIDLLVIGYGFGDTHINSILAKAVMENGLAIHLITPESIASFKKNLQEMETGNTILKGLKGYHKCNLEEMFPKDQSKSNFYLDVMRQFFKRDIRP